MNSGSNAGVPITRPATVPLVRGPLRIWRGHPSPIPWFGRFEASHGYQYAVADRESEDRFSPLCHTCVIEVIYRYRGFCDVTWIALKDSAFTCDWCDRYYDVGSDTIAP